MLRLALVVTLRRLMLEAAPAGVEVNRGEILGEGVHRWGGEVGQDRPDGHPRSGHVCGSGRLELETLGQSEAETLSRSTALGGSSKSLTMPSKEASKLR